MHKRLFENEDEHKKDKKWIGALFSLALLWEMNYFACKLYEISIVNEEK